MIQQHLKKLGLNDKESGVYLAALELGGASVQDLSKKSGVHRATTYLCIEKLKELGLINEIKKGKKTEYFGEYPEKLLENLVDQKKEIEKRQLQIESLLPELKAIYNFSKDKPKVRFFEGQDGIKQIYLDTLYNNKEIHAFLSVEKISKELLSWLYKEYAPLRKKNSIKAYVIGPEDKNTSKYKDRDKSLLKETKLIDPKKYPFSVEIDMYANKVAIMSYSSKKMFGVIIEGTEVYNTMKYIFNLIWDNLD